MVDNSTTAYERKMRRREVIRLRAQGFSQSEIAEETGFSKSTITRDIERINAELAKLDDPDNLRRMLRQGAMELYEAEFQDLEAADREGDERAKHRAKSSMRQTLEFIEKLEGEIGGAGESEADSWVRSLPEEEQEKLADIGGIAVEEILGE